MKTVIAVYDSLEDAGKAVAGLRDFGIPGENISLVVNDITGEFRDYLQDHEVDQVSEPKEGISDRVKGAGIGAVVGGLGGFLVGLGALAIPGIGPVVAAGPIVAALAGLGVGAAAGGLVGYLKDIGVSNENAEYYNQAVQRGGVLVAVKAEEDQAESVSEILGRYEPVNLEARAREWANEGKAGIEQEIKPYGSVTTDITQQTLQRVGVFAARPVYHDYEPSFREHHSRELSDRGSYEQYEPAYRHGFMLGCVDPNIRCGWEEIAPEAKRRWEADYPDLPWEDYQPAVREGWGRVTTPNMQQGR